MERITPEPWLRGSITDVHPVVAQLLYSFQQAWEDLEYFTSGLSDEQTWSRPNSVAPVGFHIRHIGGSIDRLLTYVRGEQLSADQMSVLKSEMESRGGISELLATLRHQLDSFEAEIRRLDPLTFGDVRKVGRKELPTSVGALLVHIAEHTQRHVGQAIVTAKLVRTNEAAH
jgi:uncharacterized damage-inducible protein DinB